MNDVLLPPKISLHWSSNKMLVLNKSLKVDDGNDGNDEGL